MYSQSPFSTRRAYDFKNVSSFLNSQLSYTYDETNQELSQLTGVSVKKYLPLTPAACSEI
jgi:endonuclease III